MKLKGTLYLIDEEGVGLGKASAAGRSEGELTGTKGESWAGSVSWP
jgi:hypothetical protein